MGSPPPDNEEELIVTGGIDDVVKIWKYRYSSGTAEKNGCVQQTSLVHNDSGLKQSIKLKSNTHFIRDGGLSVKHELRDHSLGVVSVTLSADGSRLASRWVQHSGQVVNNSFLVGKKGKKYI